MTPAALSQQGLGLPAALFVIVILAMIVLAMASLQETGSRTFNFQLLSARAFYAAESGAQVGVNRLNLYGASPLVCNTPAAATPTSIFTNLTLGGSLNGCQVTVDCRQVTVNSQVHYTLVSTGTCGAGIEAATRVIEVRVR